MLGVSRATVYRELAVEGSESIPADLLERRTNALACWDGRGPTPGDDLQSGKEMASAIMALLVWNSKQ